MFSESPYITATIQLATYHYLRYTTHTLHYIPSDPWSCSSCRSPQRRRSRDPGTSPHPWGRSAPGYSGVVWCGVVWCGVVWCGVYGVVYGTVCGLVQCREIVNVEGEKCGLYSTNTGHILKYNQRIIQTHYTIHCIPGFLKLHHIYYTLYTTHHTCIIHSTHYTCIIHDTTYLRGPVCGSQSLAVLQVAPHSVSPFVRLHLQSPGQRQLDLQ